ncbi:RE1 [Symbiodinium sp. KB8]|nr:RE1 [Symbiodinium sp. KB8]
MMFGVLMMKISIRCFGSEEACLLGALDLCKAFQPRLDMSARASTGQTPLPRPATGSKSIWKWNKQELVSEALRVGIAIHPKWTVPEIRSVIMEHRAQTSNAVEDTTPKRLGSMTLGELKTTAAEHNINLPTRVTRGQAMRLIRDATEDLSHKVMTFGCYRGWTFADTPEGYQEWAIAEVERSSNASEDLRMYANWARNKDTAVMSSVTYDASLDPEFNASTPYEPTESDMMSWRMVSHGPPEDQWRAVTHGYASERTLTPGTASTPKAKAKVPPRAQETDSISSMEHEVGDEALEEIRKLEGTQPDNFHYAILDYLYLMGEQMVETRNFQYMILDYLYLMGEQMVETRSFQYMILDYLYQMGTTARRISRVMNMFGFETVKIDLPEWDLSRADCRRDLIRFVNQSKPDVIWCSPPQKGDVHNQLGDDDLQVHYNFAKLLYGIQMKRGLLGVIELPKGSSGWDKDKLGDLGGHAIHLDLCAYGAYKTTDADLDVDAQEDMNTYPEKFCYEVGEAISTVIGEMMSNSTPDVKEQNVSHDENQTCEVLARTAIHEKSYNFATLLEIASSLKLGHIAGHRMATSAEAGSPLGIIGGLWVHGGVHGLTKTCSTIPWVIKYINKFARHHGVQGWTSFSLTKNLLTNVHRDPNNLAGYDSVTTSFGNFSGGELWTHDDHQEDNKEAVWRKGLPGTTVTTRERLVAFDSREPHATQPWTGERWCLTWYTSRAVLKTTLEERDELRALGFPMNSLANTKRSADIPPGEFIRWPERRRPRKSTRTQLWKMAKRLSSFATWSILATTTFLDNAMMTAAFDEPAPTIDLMHHNTPVLFEIGGWDQTMEATAKGIEAVEPMVNLDLHDPPTLTRVKDILEELKPRTLWIHGDHFGDPAGLDEVIELQRNIGGNVTVEGRLNGPMWSSNFGTFLYQMPGVATYRSDDLLRAQFGRRDHALCKREDDVVFGSTNADVLLRNYLEGKNDQETSRQIFPVEAEPRGGARQGNESSSSRGASAINFRDPQPRPEVASSLRRLHQNLGHPAVSDLTRHLRLAGAGPEVVAAAKNMTCEVCRRAQQGKSPKPATLPTTTSFNEIIGVDAFTVYDCQGKKLEMFSIYDYGTSYHIVGELPGHSTEAMEQALCDLWTKVFGPPRTILVDLETGLQAGLERYSAWFGTRVRSAAGQAPWQVGAVERHGGVWKHMWKKVVDEHSILKESPGDIKMGITAINAAKNELRRQGGFSPTQAVYGRDPDVPGELLDHRDPQQTDEILTRDQLRAREQVLRQAARIAYHRAQVDSRLRRALLQRSRVSGEDLNPGDVVYFLRKPKNKKDWRWVGPATVVGHEKKNLWVASAGRCHLVAPEHVRKATSEEVGDLFTLRATQDDLQRLLDQEPGDPQAYDYPENAHEDIGENVDEDLVLPPGDDMNKDLLSEVIFEDEEMPMEGERRRGPPGDPPVVLNKRYRTKGPETAFFAKSVRFNLEPEELEPRSTSSRELATIQKGILMNFRDNAEITTEDLDDHCNYAYMVRKATTERGRQKQLEKEIPWSYIPEEQKQAFKEAELQQWMEHVNHDAVQPVSVEESRQILRDKPERVLPSRYAYRDKNWSKRKKDANIGWRPKARLVIGGHLDPDLHLGLQTSAPTVSRQGVLLLLQILASRLDRQWGASAGDITAAFLNGKALQRELYIKQPRTGLGDLHPEQLVRLTKGVFGLVDSPAAWWGEFKGVLGREEFIVNGMRLKFFHCPLDPCIFQLRELNGDNEAHGEPLAYLAVHVDDVLLIGPKDLRRTLQERISALFPVQEWEEGAFDYIGSYIEVTNDEVHVTQTSYTNTRLFEIPIKHGQQGDEPATVEQKADNRSLIGALSWLAGQTRPDLQTGVSMAQQLQRDPTVDDIKFSNQLSKRAQEHDHRGIVIRPVDLRHAVLLAYRDAGWANAPQDCEDPYYALYPEDETAGEIREGPFSTKDRRAKRSNSKIASQLGGLYLLADCEILRGHRKRVSLLDWRSAACDRVCRSTFAAESMGCCGAIENADFIRKFLSTLLTGDLCRREDGRFQVRYLSDCRSLYDHLAREGIPRIPSERRLAIDMAAIRQDLAITGRMCWVPTDQQLADIMTKPQKAGDWWETLVGEIKLPFVESF